MFANNAAIGRICMERRQFVEFQVLIVVNLCFVDFEGTDLYKQVHEIMISYKH